MLLTLFRTTLVNFWNQLIFLVGVASMLVCMTYSVTSMARGDHCLDGSMSFTAWWHGMYR